MPSPHIVTSIRFRIYNPGLVTSIVLFLPFTIWMLAREVSAGTLVRSAGRADPRPRCGAAYSGGGFVRRAVSAGAETRRSLHKAHDANGVDLLYERRMNDVRQNPASPALNLMSTATPPSPATGRRATCMMMTHTETPRPCASAASASVLFWVLCNRSALRDSKCGLYARSCGLCYRSTPNFRT